MNSVYVYLNMMYLNTMTESYLEGVRAYAMAERCGVILRLTFYSFWANACLNIFASILRVLLPGAQIPSIMPSEVLQLGPYGSLGAALVEVSFAVSHAEISNVYVSWTLTILLGTTDIIEAMRLLQRASNIKKLGGANRLLSPFCLVGHLLEESGMIPEGHQSYYNFTAPFSSVLKNSAEWPLFYMGVVTWA